MWKHVQLSRSVPEILSHVAGTLSKQPTTKQSDRQIGKKLDVVPVSRFTQFPKWKSLPCKRDRQWTNTTDDIDLYVAHMDQKLKNRLVHHTTQSLPNHGWNFSVSWRNSAFWEPPNNKPYSRGREQLFGSVWARCPLHRGFDPPLGKFSGIGDFSLRVNMGSNSIPPNTPSDESINRGIVCAHMHFITRTQKILMFMS